ncbi:TonB-dependent receptor [Spongiivirga citrea]|uniref:TonB-dependent receptor plug domain-containing protein n=1 Tax=Spongiivirga citrea TaxID=1481457 RepID=A0A6M0CGV2_9FLAO|nr:TonB-dependent receptor [Spongiivirga citrea]NER17146.1 TonB-dependent receptor plug domain-containing protein [Spongiivirga citrea]
MKTIKSLFAIAAIFLMTTVAYSQGVTTSAINGQVTDNLGEPLPGANVVAIHNPSGTKYGATTDFDGFYRISGMRTGGPYTITISYVGFEDSVENNVFLQLGQTQRFSKKMAESATALEEVVVTGVAAGSVFNQNKTGTETNISQREIQTIPSASRSIADFVRVTPQAQVTEGNDGFSISLGGQNNRYNAIYIDGAVNNDVFGLAGSGTNGGQTGVNPFSVDAIESFQVAIAPFDVRVSGFAGGAISAVTRSGTNEVKGSAYYFVRNESLAGKTPPSLVGNGESAEKLDEFTAQTYGVRVGGPIVKDKLFYFINYERQDDETPQPFNVSNYVGDTDAAGIESLRQFLINTYGYDPGGFQNNTRTLVSDKLTAKLDWNVNDNHKISLKHSLVKGDNLEARNSSNFRVGFINGSELFNTTTNSTSFEWNGTFGNKFSNNLVIGYTAVRDDRDPAGSPFPTVDIRDGSGTISFGAEPFSTANLLDQDIFTFTNNFSIYQGRHTITLGTHNEYSKVKNLFFAFNFGDYTYNSVSDFIANQNLDFYQRGYSLVGGGGIGDESSGSADFDLFQLGFYAQDEVQMTENFKMTFGVRFDTPFWNDGPVNDDFNNRTIPLLEAAGKDLQGAKVGQGVSNYMHISPRVGFNWDVKGKRSTQIRGGLGIFTSRLPLVWPGGTYNNNGVTGGFTTNFDLPGEVTFNPDVNNQPVDVTPGSGGTGGNVDLFARNFKLPQVFKVNLAIDQKLPIWGLVASVEGVFNDNVNAIFYENLNVGAPVGTLNGADNRPFYNRRDEVDDTYGRIMLASNTSAGYSYNTTFTLRKPFENGFAGSVSYTYGDAMGIFDGTSSQNSSQWRNIQTVNGKNSNLPVTRSDFAQGSRFIANLSYAKQWNDNLKTTIGLFYEGSQGLPFSYTYREGRDLLNDDSRDNALIYVPVDASEITLVDGANGLTSAQQWEALDNYISGNEYLNSRRGDYAERNGDRGPWSHIVDLKFLQDFSLNFNETKHTFQLSLDIFNFTNLLNEDWGKKKFIAQNVQLLRTENDGPDPEFSFDPGQLDRIEQLDDLGIQSSRWQMQVGLRYIFN